MEARMKKAALLTCLVLLLAATGCSSGDPTSLQKDVKDVKTPPGQDSDGQTLDSRTPEIESPDILLADTADARGAEDGAGGETDGWIDEAGIGNDLPLDVPKDEGQAPDVTVGTYAEAGTVPAGIPLQFDCVVQGLPGGTYATYLHVSGPADVDVDNLAVTFQKAGKYSVACRVKWDEGEVEDPTPLKIDVLAGVAETIETELSHYSVKAGDTVMVTCTIHDGFGNKIETPAKVAVNPQVGLDVFGMKILAIKAGMYQVACVEPASGLSDPTPEILTVGWGIPKKIETELGAETIVAGKDTTVTCTSYDSFGNEVPDFPVVVFLSPGLTINGFNVGGTKAGAFQVICVPMNDSWDLFTLTPRLLTVIPGPATGVALEPVPAKPVYMMFETILFIVTAVDDYGNVVDGVELLPVTYEPADEGIIQKAELKYKFETEGVFLFTACLVLDPGVCGHREITVDGYGPVITIKYPERGATIMGKPAVSVTGNVIDPVSGVEKFTINNNLVPLEENGDFVYPISAKQGLNMIVAIAEDPNGFKTLLVQSFYYSPVWHKVDINDPEGSKIQDNIMFFLADEAFDKVPHDYSKPDNLSTIVELALKTLDIGSFLPNPVASAGPYKVYVGPFSYAPPVIHIFPIPGGILAEVHIYNIKVHVEAKGSCKVLFIDLCPDVSGDVKIEEIQMWEGLNIWVENGKIKMSEYENYIGIYGLDVHIDGILGFLFGWIINWFVDGYVGVLEQTAMEMVKEQVASITEGMLKDLELNQQLDIPNPLNPNAPPVQLSLVSTIRELLFTNTGVEVRLDAAVLSPKNINKNPLGSIGRASCLKWVPEKFVIDKEEFVVMAIHDDMFNEVLFAAWWAGLLDMVVPVSDFVDPATLEDAMAEFGIDPALLPFDFNDMTIHTEFFLPPIVTSCNDPYDEKLQMQIGDIYIEMNTKMLNEPVTMGMFVTMAAEAEIEIVNGAAGQEISLAIGEIDPMVAQVTYISDNLKGGEGFLSMIIQAILLPELLGSFANNSLATFPLPVINVSELSDFLPPNMVWKFVIDKFWRELGFTSLIAHIEAQ